MYWISQSALHGDLLPVEMNRYLKSVPVDKAKSFCDVCAMSETVYDLLFILQ